jgi:PAS domain S-box-containing protein
MIEEDNKRAGLQAGAARNGRAGAADELRMNSEQERELRQQVESRFGEMINALPAAIYSTDAEGRLTNFNEAAVKLSGRVPELGTDRWCVTWKLYLPDGTPLPHDECPMAIALKEGRIVSGEYIAERPDGSRFWFTPYPTLLRDSAGRVTGAVNMLLDITDRKIAEEALRRSEERSRAIVDTTPECVKVVAADGTLLHMNSSGLAMVGADSPEAVIGKSVYSLIAPEFRDAWCAFNARVCSGEKASMEFEIVGLTGERRRAETHAVPLQNPDGSVAQLAITRDITERQRSERIGLLLGAIVDSSDDAIVSKDLNGTITSWNKGAERLFGYTSEEVVGKSITIIIPPERLGEEPEILRRLQRGERVDHFETIRRRKDGALLNISLTISPVKDENGKVIGASKIARNITDRKRAEAAIEELNSQLAAELTAMTRMQQLSTRLAQAGEFSALLGEIIEAGIEITNAGMGNIRLLEGGVLKIVAQRGFESPFLEFFDTVEHGATACRAALDTGKRVMVEDVAHSPIYAGSQAALRVMLQAGARAVQSTPLISRSGQLLGTFSTHYRATHRLSDRDERMLDLLARQAADLIERKRAEAALLASEGRFRQLADSMPQIVWTARPDGQLDYYNERWYEFTGFTRDQFGDRSWQPILHPEDAQPCFDSWYASVRAGNPYRIEQRFWDRHERRWRWFMTRALPVRNEAGDIVKWFGTSTDIDEQKRVETELRQANDDLEQFAYSASHDLQEPLRGIKIYSQLLTSRHGSKLDGQALEFLDFLQGSASRMEMLVRDLLEYTQITKVEAPERNADANDALRFTLANLRGAIAESGACITSDPLPSVPVHDAHLKQLFQNLVGNAIKYRSSDRAPVVHVSAAPLGTFWLFSVADNGIGIEPEYKERVFGLFKRLHSGDEYSGTGIGLAICQRIVDRYHGRIWVESTPGQGSDFKFTLPV